MNSQSPMSHLTDSMSFWRQSISRQSVQFHHCHWQQCRNKYFIQRNWLCSLLKYHR